MSVFSQMAAHEYGDLHLCVDEATQLRAVVAIHDTRLGPALGGTRFISYSSDDAGLLDAMRLARAMTSKAALAGLAHGGGKAVIIKPEGDFDRAALLRRFGGFVESLGGRYITTEDSGTSPQDMKLIREVTSHVCGFDVASGGSGDPSPFTALGVRRGIEACVKFKLGRQSLQGIHVAVQGVGNVGYHLCRELHAEGATLTVTDTQQNMLERVRDELGAAVVAPDEIHRVACDVYAPCALGGALDDDTIAALRCQIVAGAANNQFAHERHGAQLAARDILYAPDYAINAGGLINVAQEVLGYHEATARERTLQVYDTILEICERAKRAEQPPHEIADAMVRELLAKAAA